MGSPKPPKPSAAEVKLQQEEAALRSEQTAQLKREEQAAISEEERQRKMRIAEQKAQRSGGRGRSSLIKTSGGELGTRSLLG